MCVRREGSGGVGGGGGGVKICGYVQAGMGLCTENYSAVHPVYGKASRFILCQLGTDEKFYLYRMVSEQSGPVECTFVCVCVRACVRVRPLKTNRHKSLPRSLSSRAAW